LSRFARIKSLIIPLEISSRQTSFNGRCKFFVFSCPLKFSASVFAF
jgi:hypothetical protein